MKASTIAFTPRRRADNLDASKQQIKPILIQNMRNRRSGSSDSSNSSDSDIPTLSTQSNEKFHLESEQDSTKESSSPPTPPPSSPPVKHIRRNPASPQQPSPDNVPMQISRQNAHSDPTESLIIIRDRRVFTKSYRLCRGELPLFFATQKNITAGKVHLISRNPEPEIDAAGFVGYLKIHKGASRFTLVKCSDGQKGELMGIAFTNKGASINARQLRLVIDKSDELHSPEDKSSSISKIASEGGADSSRYLEFESTLPEITESGGLSLCFGPAFVLSSVKNFRFDTKSGNTFLMIYKISTDTFSIKFQEPISELMAFGIGIAAVSGVGYR